MEKMSREEVKRAIDYFQNKANKCIDDSGNIIKVNLGEYEMYKIAIKALSILERCEAEKIKKIIDKHPLNIFDKNGNVFGITIGDRLNIENVKLLSQAITNYLLGEK
jgi:hypothetical protein